MTHPKTVSSSAGRLISVCDAIALIAGARWVFAKTMPDWPHEYTVKTWRPNEAASFEAFCRLVRTLGEVQPWPPPPAAAIYHNRYLEIDGYSYWAMGLAGDTGPVADLTVINRAIVAGGTAQSQIRRMSAPR